MSKTPTLKELQLEAKKLNVKGYTRLSKSELQQAVGIARKAKAKNIIPLPTTLEEASATFGSHTKSMARKLRKQLRRKGRNDLAATRRVTTCA